MNTNGPIDIGNVSPDEIAKILEERAKESGTPHEHSHMLGGWQALYTVLHEKYRQTLPTKIELEKAAALAEDISWLKTMRADYAQLVEAIGDDMEDYVSSWDEEAHQDCLARTQRAINELAKLYPYGGY